MVFALDAQDKELFRRFRLRTVSTLGGPTVVSIYENFVLGQGFAVSAEVET